MAITTTTLIRSAGLRYSLWRGQRAAAGRSLPIVRGSRLDPAVAE